MLGEADERLDKLTDEELSVLEYLVGLVHDDVKRYSPEALATPWDVRDALLHERALHDEKLSQIARDNEHLANERDVLLERMAALEAQLAAQSSPPQSANTPPSNVTSLVRDDDALRAARVCALYDTMAPTDAPFIARAPEYSR